MSYDPNKNDNPYDQQPPTLEENVKTQVKDKNTWLRLLLIVLFGAVFYAVFFITCIVGVIQFIARVLTGKPLASLREFSLTLSEYAQELVNYITYVSDVKPYPFKE